MDFYKETLLSSKEPEIAFPYKPPSDFIKSNYDYLFNRDFLFLFLWVSEYLI